MCVKTIVVGFLVNFLAWLGIVMWWFFFVPLLLTLVAWIFGAYHGYVVFTKSK